MRNQFVILVLICTVSCEPTDNWCYPGKEWENLVKSELAQHQLVDNVWYLYSEFKQFSCSDVYWKVAEMHQTLRKLT